MSHSTDKAEEKGAAGHDNAIVVSETGAGVYQNLITSGPHRLLADEPTSVGGLGSGPNPYDYLAAALGACTSMTLRMYARHKKLALGRITVSVTHGKVPAEHYNDCGAAAGSPTGKVDRFERLISVDGQLDAALEQKLLEIADKCPVHRTLTSCSVVVTRLAAKPAHA